MPDVGIDVWWLPLGAGGHFVRLNGKIYEAIRALRERRDRRDLYHTALEVYVPEGRYVIENAWPIPDANGSSRGVVVEGPVFGRAIAQMRALRYEIRKWPDGVIFDAAWAVESPQRVSNDLVKARRVLEFASSVPVKVWGRDADHTGEMWNSNSVISWILASAGLSMRDIHPPRGGQAPGWKAGIAVAMVAQNGGAQRGSDRVPRYPRFRSRS